MDRCLGVALAESIRGQGYDAYTLRDVYGEERARTVPDSEWIAYGAKAGRILLTKDYKLLRREMMAEALRGTDGRIFCLANANLNREGIRDTFLFHLNRIIQRARHRGPYIYAVLPKTVDLRWPLSTDRPRR